MGTRCLRIALVLAVVLQYAGMSAADACDGCTEPATIDCASRPGCKTSIRGRSIKDVGGECKFTCGASTDYLLTVPSLPKDIRELTCQGNNEWTADNDGTPLAINEAVCITDYSCSKKNNMVPSTCVTMNQMDSSIGCEELPFDDDGDKRCSTGKTMYFKAAADTNWDWRTTVECNKRSGEWAVDKMPLASGDQVICASNQPLQVKHCTSDNPLDGTCPSDAPTGAQCESFTAFDENLPLKCPDGKQLFYKKSSETTWTKTTSILCNLATGKWREGEVIQNHELIAGDGVVCAMRRPQISCPAFSSCDSISGAGIKCERPQVNGVFHECSSVSGFNLYFQRKGDPNALRHKFQEAVSVECKEGEWQVKYIFGSKTENKDTEIEALICADKNPDSNACQTTTRFTPPHYDGEKMNPLFYEAGKQAACESQHHKFCNSDGCISSNFAPICDSDSSWKHPNGHDYGAKIGCALPHCKKCGLPTKIAASTFTGQDDARLPTTVGGECFNLGCKDDSINSKFAVKILGDAEYRFHAGRVECTAQQNWVLDSDKTSEVEEAACAQVLYCLHDDFAKVKLDCPAAPAIPGCVSPTSSNKPTGELACTQPLKMFIRDDSKTELYWDEITTDTIKCDTTTGKWPVTIVGGTAEEKRDHRHTVICAETNPQPKKTTTTTTTTPAPLPPICDFCRTHLPPLLACDTCSNNTDYRESNAAAEKGPEDKCIMRPRDKRKLVINNHQETDKNLVCKRKDAQWRTEDGVVVTKFSARIDNSADTWKPASYIIVAVVILAIGGMGISCVVIYMRMRKQISSKEKKKERGVTKKYTSSNVIKTDVKSDRGKSLEGGNSKASSRVDDDEEIPALKL